MGDSGPSSWEDDNFNLRFAFFSRTEFDVRMRILEGRRARLQERLDRAQRHAQSGGDRYVSELHRHSIESVEREMGAPLPSLSREEKQKAIRLLDDRGAFILRRAVEDVADAMGVSRITVYNYLNALHR